MRAETARPEHDMRPSSFKRITNMGGDIRLPIELGKYRVPSREQREEHARAIIQTLRNHYEPAYKQSPETLTLGLTALETFLLRFAPIPRPTEGEAPMQFEMVERAREFGRHVEIDEVGNIAFVIPGRKNGKIVENPLDTDVVVLQHHLDEVAVAKEGSGKKPETEGIETELIQKEGEYWIQAKGGLTTLGADNGAGGAVLWEVAEALADSGKDYPTFVVLGTVGEEGKMDGATGISFNKNPNSIVAPLLEHAHVVVNNDMELDKPEPTIIVGSFGLETFEITQEVITEPIPSTYQTIELSLSGLQGGHSGLYPDRAHAGKVMIEHLTNLLGQPGEMQDWRLCSFTAGEKHNEIANTSHATIAVPRERATNLRQQLAVLSAEQKALYGESLLELTATETQEQATTMLTAESTRQTVALLEGMAAKHGSINHFMYGKTGEDLFDRALNMGVVRVTPKGVTIDTSARIGIAATPQGVEAFDRYEPELLTLVQEVGGNAQVHKGVSVPTWKLAEASPLPDIAATAFNQVAQTLSLQEQAKLKRSVVTAGLEVSMFQNLLLQAQDLVFGMYITDIHKAGEALHVPSFILNAALVKTFLELLSTQLTGESAQAVRRQTDELAA